MSDKVYNITKGTGNDFWKFFVNGIWFDDDEAMAKNFWGENLHIEFLDSRRGEIIWVRSNCTFTSYGSDCFYVPEGTTVSEIINAMTYTFFKPEDNYDPVLDGGRGSIAASAANHVYDEFDRKVIFKNPDLIDALDDIRSISQFEKDHPNFKMDVYVEICQKVDNYNKRVNCS